MVWRSRIRTTGTVYRTHGLVKAGPVPHALYIRAGGKSLNNARPGFSHRAFETTPIESCILIAAKQGKEESNEHFFHPTRFRYVSNELEELAQRYVKFNIKELSKQAAQAAGSRRCIAVTKGDDGSFNRVLTLDMDDGKQVIAKIPTPNAGRAYSTTASEVATMEFVRSVLGVPVPKVLAWSSKAAENSVGADFIIMEKLKGVPLSVVWGSMPVDTRSALLRNFAAIQKSWMSASFKRYGSLYFSGDLEQVEQDAYLYMSQDGVENVNQRFAVGPSTGRGWNDDGRSHIELPRGPWHTAEEYMTAVGLRDIACTEQLARLPRSWISLHGPGTYIPTREKKIQALRYYLELIRYLLPPDPSLSAATLWHGDTHAENIFVNPENPAEIIGIIDWQSTEIAPLFEYARKPGFLDHDGTSVEGLERPKKPADFDQLDPQAKSTARILWINQTLEVYYEAFVRKTNPRLGKVLEYCETSAENLLVLARHLLVDGEAHYVVAVEMLQSEWSEVPAVKASSEAPAFPFHFSEKETTIMYRDAEDAVKAMNAMNELKAALGPHFPDRGAVLPGNYERFKSLIQNVKEQFLQKHARDDRERALWEENWPFD